MTLGEDKEVFDTWTVNDLLFCFTLILIRYVVAVWYGAGLATARSWVRILPVAAVYQRQLSVPSLRGRLLSTSESFRWGVNGHTTRCTFPVSVVLRLPLVFS